MCHTIVLASRGAVNSGFRPDIVAELIGGRTGE